MFFENTTDGLQEGSVGSYMVSENGSDDALESWTVFLTDASLIGDRRGWYPSGIRKVVFCLLKLLDTHGGKTQVLSLTWSRWVYSWAKMSAQQTSSGTGDIQGDRVSGKFLW